MYSIETQVVNFKLKKVIMRDDTFIVLPQKYIERAETIDGDSDMDETDKQMKLQTLYLYLMATDNKVYRLNGTKQEYQSELEMEDNHEQEIF